MNRERKPGVADSQASQDLAVNRECNLESLLRYGIYPIWILAFFLVWFLLAVSIGHPAWPSQLFVDALRKWI